MAEIRIRLGDDTNYIDIDKSMIESVSVLKQTTTDASSIQYGVLPSTGSLEIIDKGDFIKNKIESGELPYSNVPVRIYVNENLYATMYTSDDSNYTNDKHFTTSLKDNLSKWDELIYNGRSLTESMSAYELIKEVLFSFNYTETQIENMFSSTIVYGNENNEGTILSYLSNINIEYPYLNNSTYREVIDKFCVLAQLSCISDKNGMPVFYSARPTLPPSEISNAFLIEPRFMNGDFEKSMFVKNKYNGIEANINKNTFALDNIYSCSIGISYNGESGQYDLSVSDQNVSANVESIGSVQYVDVYANIALEGNNYLKNSLNDLSVYLEYSGTTSKYTGQLLGTQEEVQSFTHEFLLSEDYKDFIVINPEISFEDNVLTISRLGIALQVPAEYSLGTGEVVHVSRLSNISIKIKSNTVKATEEKISSGTNNLRFYSNELISDSTIFGETLDMVNIISSNVSNDYSTGKNNGSLNIFPSNISRFQGNKIDFSNGEMISVSNTIGIKDDVDNFGKQRFWKVVSEKFTYDGEPLLSFGVLESKSVELVKVNISENVTVTRNLYGNSTQVNNGDYIPKTSEITVVTKEDYSENIGGIMGNRAFAYDTYINDRLVKDGTFLLNTLVDENNELNITVKEFVVYGSLNARLDLPTISKTTQPLIGSVYTINHSSEDVSINRVVLTPENFCSVIKTYESGETFASGANILNSVFNFIAIDNTEEKASSNILSYIAD